MTQYNLWNNNHKTRLDSELEQITLTNLQKKGDTNKWDHQEKESLERESNAKKKLAVKELTRL